MGAIAALAWEEVYTSWDKYIWKVAHDIVKKNYGATDLGADDLHQEGLLILYKCYQKYGHKDKEEFERIFKTSVAREIRNKVISNVSQRQMIVASSDEIAGVLGEEQQFTINDLPQEVYEEIEELKKHLRNPIAKAIVCELTNPSPLTLHHVKGDMKRREFFRKLGRKINGRAVNVPSTVDIKLKYIRRALNITVKQATAAKEEILEVRRALKLRDAYLNAGYRPHLVCPHCNERQQRIPKYADEMRVSRCKYCDGVFFFITVNCSNGYESYPMFRSFSSKCSVRKAVQLKRGNEHMDINQYLREQIDESPCFGDFYDSQDMICQNCALAEICCKEYNKRMADGLQDKLYLNHETQKFMDEFEKLFDENDDFEIVTTDKSNTMETDVKQNVESVKPDIESNVESNVNSNANVTVNVSSYSPEDKDIRKESIHKIEQPQKEPTKKKQTRKYRRRKRRPNTAKMSVAELWDLLKELGGQCEKYENPIIQKVHLVKAINKMYKR